MGLLSAQSDVNRFQQEDGGSAFNKTEETATNEVGKSAEDCDEDGIPNETDPTPGCGPSNVGDPNPIDDYIPVLLIVGLGFIIYYTQVKKKKLS